MFTKKLSIIRGLSPDNPLINVLRRFQNTINKLIDITNVPITEVSDSDYDVLIKDSVILSYPAMANRNVNLYAITKNLEGKKLFIKNNAASGIFNVIINPDGTDTINGSSSHTLASGAAITIMAYYNDSGCNWIIWSLF